MNGKAACKTAEEALTEATVRAVETLGEPGMLTEARFGRYSDLSGWHWALTVTREIPSDPGREQKDDLHRRVSLVTESWKRDVARYRTGEDEEEGR